MLFWLSQLAATLENPDSDPHPDLNAHLVFFLFLPVCSTTDIARNGSIIVKILNLYIILLC